MAGEHHSTFGLGQVFTSCCVLSLNRESADSYGIFVRIKRTICFLLTLPFIPIYLII